MGVMQVFKFPHPVLKQQARPVTRFETELRELAENMLATMYHEGGIGLAANQVGQLKRLVVMDLRNGEETEEGPPPRDPRVFVNPRLLDASGEIVTEEGCLSVVEFTAEVKRAQSIEIEYETLDGQTRHETLEAMGSVCLQHEMDHLDGKLFIDHLPPLKRQMVKKRLTKLAKTA